MYSLGGPHPYRDHCKKVLEKIKSRQILPVTNTEVLQEILYRYFSIGRASLGEMAYHSMVQFCLEVFPIRLPETSRALELLKSHENITARDAIHAATMINHGLKGIISTDTHFDLISGIKRIDPKKFK